MLDTNDTEYFKVKGIQINDPSINHDDTLTEAPAAAYVREWANIFNLNSTFMARLNNASAACGYDEFLENSLQFPPKGVLPTAPDSSRPGCAVWEDAVFAGEIWSSCLQTITPVLTMLCSTLRQPVLQFLTHYRLLSLPMEFNWVSVSR